MSQFSSAERELRETSRQNSGDSFRRTKNFRDNPICSILHEEVTARIAVDNSLPRPVQWRLYFAAGEAPDAYWGKRAVDHIQSAAPAGF